MTQALAERPTTIPALTGEELDLVKRTVANGATDAELKLFLFDCQRRGVHPLDKLLHFTKRGGKYTPVTSIDFMRSQAAMTGEMAGSDEPLFTPRHIEAGKHPDEATVTVYRLTQGQRFAYTATARWSEYCPDNAPMWKRMPHTMLGKCAEALALRKAFPQQLSGLYAREELDQAGEPSGYTVSAPTAGHTTAPLVASGPIPSEPNGGDSATSPDRDPSLLYIERVDRKPTKNANVTKFVVVLSDGRELSTIKSQLGDLAEQVCQDGDPITVETKGTKWGEDLIALHRVERVIDIHADDPHTEPIDEDAIPF